MNNRQCELFLEKLLEAETPDEFAALLNDQHVIHCPDCMKQVKQTMHLMEIMGKRPPVTPPASMRRHFYHALQQMETKKQPATVHKIAFRWVAAACMLLIAGAVFVYQVSKRSQPDPIVAGPTMIAPVEDNVSVSQRVNGISTAVNAQRDDNRLVATLLEILERDKNPHVRMAAFYGLVKYKEIPEVHNRLISVLRAEKDPMMQVLLINTLTENKEPRALEAVRSLLMDKETRKEVKTLALSKI